MILVKLNYDGSSLLGGTYFGGVYNDGLNTSNQLKFNYADEIRGEIDIDQDGNPNYLDSDGSISDIGANPYNNQYCFLSGDVNNDGVTNVIDIVDLVNCILFSDNCTICFDINEDNEYNILDILDIVNMIINY